ncbi:hypothetical protein IMX26_03780 [Clostridium sp. 'deep sea']|uniref:CAP-associated domain-containing protein n=1 Tax=Clostridium sp. 'deep sea' TaxID=2779445 RepID=UPI0018964ADA|nr:CAP-associated domain-containing protein [Clostridium sp. 'deep sea']QOR35951.1 hypothetical protein IMX26_03780 [Clostridium sp. 'deep sea']
MRKFFRAVGIGIIIGMMLLAIPGAADSVSKSISVYFNNVSIQVNGEKTQSDNFIYNGTTYIPLREVSEILGKQVDYDNNTKTVYITDKNITPTEPPEPEPNDPEPTKPTEPVVSSSAINGAEIGMTAQELVSSLGSPNRKDPSAYGFTWYIYNKDYNKYVQVGVKDNKVVAVYSNIGSWQLNNKVKIGTPKSTVEKTFGNSLNSITEGNYRYNLSSNSENVVYSFDNNKYIYVFYDKHNSYTVTGVMIWSKSIPFRDMFYGNYNNIDTKAWADAMEKQLFDTSNTFRIRMGLKAFTTDDKVNKSAYLHSYDMSTNNYFSHTNLNGQSPFDRMKDQGIKYSRAAENIAYGQRNAIFANHGLMNSEGHRKNLLGNYSRLGTGVHFNTSRNQAYYTQNFYTPYN